MRKHSLGHCFISSKVIAKNIHLTALIGDGVISIEEVLGPGLQIKSSSLFVVL